MTSTHSQGRIVAFLLILCSCCLPLGHAAAQRAVAPPGVSREVFNYWNNICSAQAYGNEIVWGVCMRKLGFTVQYSDGSVGGPIVTPPPFGPPNIIQG
jgi:hypothetical protein